MKTRRIAKLTGRNGLILALLLAPLLTAATATYAALSHRVAHMRRPPVTASSYVSTSSFAFAPSFVPTSSFQSIHVLAPIKATIRDGESCFVQLSGDPRERQQIAVDTNNGILTIRPLTQQFLANNTLAATITVPAMTDAQNSSHIYYEQQPQFLAPHMQSAGSVLPDFSNASAYPIGFDSLSSNGQSVN